MKWYDIPLQGHFLGTMDAGDTLCDRMRAVLREPAPDIVVLTCFQRIMMLGFLGSYRSPNDPERTRLVEALNARVPPFIVPQTYPILAETRYGRAAGGIFSGLPALVCLSALVLVVLWWGLDRWLDGTLASLLPGSMK